MPAVPKLEEFRAPWETEAGEDAEIDKGKLKKYIHGLLVDKERLQTSVTEVTTERDTLKSEKDEAAREGETETDRLKRENEELKARKPEKDPEQAKENMRLQVALEKGLTLTQAKRLIGNTVEEMAADADELVKSFGGSGEGEGEEGVPSRRPKSLVNPSDPDPSASGYVDIDKALESIPRIN